VTATLIAIFALVVSILTARGAWLQARDTARHQDLLRLYDVFCAQEYRMRFWRLSMAVRAFQDENESEDLVDQGSRALLSPNPPEGYAEVHPWPWFRESDISYPEAAISVASYGRSLNLEEGRDFLGPLWSSDRADFLDVWSYAMRLHNWLEDDSLPLLSSRIETPARRADRAANEITALFGNELVLTLSKHRDLASRVAAIHLGTEGLALPADERGSLNFYRRYYGIADDRYALLVDRLALSANLMGVLTREHQVEIAGTERVLSGESYRDNVTATSRRLRTLPSVLYEWPRA
jgi:hypothetical protein